LLHGLGDSHEVWRHQLDPLALRHRVVALDLRGHGRSPIGDVPFDLDAMADDVRATLDELRIDRPVLAGLSMGGGVVQTLAVREPELPAALVLVSTSSEFLAATRERFLTRAERAEREGMAAVIDATVPRWFTPEFEALHLEEVERTRRTVLATSPEAFAAASRANAARDLTASLSRIRCPVLFIGGEEDPAGPRRALEIYRRELPHLLWELIPHASHLVPVEAPEMFNATLLRFLDEVERNEGSRGGDA
jgi:3-oxoadipate enol-lactonase